MRATIVRASALVAVTLAAAFTFAGASEPASAGGGACHQAPEREGTGSDIKLTRNCFAPSILRVEPGAQVTFHNHDQVLHRLSSIPGAGPGEFDMRPGEEATRRFMEPGIYPYFCDLHVSMVGTVVVGDGKSVASSAGQSQPVAVQAVESQAESPAQPGQSALAASSDDSRSSSWPFAGGAAIALAGVVAGTVIAYRARRA